VSGSDSFLSFLFLDVPFFDSFFFFFLGKIKTETSLTLGTRAGGCVRQKAMEASGR
jgi:hypothetical protein